MPRMFIFRNRLDNYTRGSSDLCAQLCSKTIDASPYQVGGFIFIIGGILFFSRFETCTDTEVWTFFGGSQL